MKLQGKTILITGAGHGLGKAIALQASRLGARVFVSDIDPTRVKAVVEEIEKSGGKARGFHFDVTDYKGILHTLREIETLGGIDILVNNAGIVKGGVFHKVPMEEHVLTASVNLIGVWNVTHAFLPLLQSRKEAAIVNVASASAFLPLANASTYAATKAAVVSFTDSLREELRNEGIGHVNVSAFCPSYVSTGLFAGAIPPLFTRFVEPEAAARALIRLIEKGQTLKILPRLAAILLVLTKPLPRPVFHWFCRLFGASTSYLQKSP